MLKLALCFCQAVRLRSAGMFAMSATLILAGLVGCNEDVAIRKYTVAKKDVGRGLPAATAESAAGIDQTILGVIVPRDGSAWFLKLMDEPAKVEKFKGDFREIVKGWSFTDSGEPRFDLVEGWTERPERQIVYSRLMHEQAGVSASVTQLPAPTSNAEVWHDNVSDQVNRWREQVSLQPIDWKSLEPQLEELPGLNQGPAKAYFISVTGKKSSSGGMSAPFLQGMGLSPGSLGPGSLSQDGARGGDATSPVSTAAPNETAPPKLLQYDTPSGWQEEPAGGIRLASFKIPSEPEPAVVAVSTASGQPEMFLDMWFGQLGMEASEEARQEVLTQAEALEVNGVTATLYTIRGGDQKEILVARIPWKEKEALFAKFTGTSEQVAEQTDAFKAFIQSIRW